MIWHDIGVSNEYIYMKKWFTNLNWQFILFQTRSLPGRTSGYSNKCQRRFAFIPRPQIDTPHHTLSQCAGAVWRTARIDIRFLFILDWTAPHTTHPGISDTRAARIAHNELTYSMYHDHAPTWSHIRYLLYSLALYVSIHTIHPLQFRGSHSSSTLQLPTIHWINHTTLPHSPHDNTASTHFYSLVS